MRDTRDVLNEGHAPALPIWKKPERCGSGLADLQPVLLRSLSFIAPSLQRSG